MQNLKQVIMERDDLNNEQYDELLKDARSEFDEYDDKEEWFADWFGLEPDYIMEAIP